MKITRAISIRQPFVELILAGYKSLEYRSTPTKLRERVYIYAALKPKDYPAGWSKVGKQRGELPTGVIVGSVEIVDCKVRANGYAYKLTSPERLRRHLKPINQPQPKFWFPKFN
jgi:hypothetical protein